MIYRNKEYTVWADVEDGEIHIQQGGEVPVVIDVTQFGALVKAIGLCADEIFRAEKAGNAEKRKGV